MKTLAELEEMHKKCQDTRFKYQAAKKELRVALCENLGVKPEEVGDVPNHLLVSMAKKVEETINKRVE